MNKEDLIELRLLFRARFRTHDFCIGEGEVEELFRELLQEPKPEEIHYDNPSNPIRLDDIMEVYDEVLSKDRINDIFTQDDRFFEQIKKK